MSGRSATKHRPRYHRRKAARVAAKVAQHEKHRAKGSRFSPEQHKRAIELILAGMKQGQVAKTIGCTVGTLGRWYKEAKERERPKITASAAPTADQAEATPIAPGSSAPKDPGYGLADYEIQAILDLKKKHPSMGPAQLRAQLKRFKGWRVSIKAIARVLRRNGYEPVHTGGRPVGEPPPISFEAPHRNALWQLDFTELRVGPEVCYLLAIEDDFSRFVVSHMLADGPTTEVAVATMREAIRRHGKPERVYSDRGSAFTAWRDITDFENFLENELIDHSLRRAHHPRGGGKIESVMATVQRELWNIVHFASVDEAKRALVQFFADYNYRRAHMGIGGLTPADRFFGRWPEVAAEIDALSRRRQGALASGQDRRLFHESLPAAERTHVLELVFVGEEAELRLLGQRVRLGRIEA